jgi:hypothetical protein
MIPTPRVRFATITVAAAMTVATLTFGSATAPAAQAAGLRNCVDLTRPSPACYELVWVNGVEVRMMFAHSGNQRPGTPNATVHNFYVIAPQTDAVQGTAPFAHDHTVGVLPGQHHGVSVFWHGYFVFCSAEGISSGACVPTLSSIPGVGTVPLAKSVNGQMLTSVETIESAVDSGYLMLIDTGAEYIGPINPAT